jgi:hypothetical protein
MLHYFIGIADYPPKIDKTAVHKPPDLIGLADFSGRQKFTIR